MSFSQNFKQSKFGFTLAEILITLAIIGIVAAMTLPMLFGSIQKKQTVAKLQKAISEINQAYKLSIDQNGGGSAEEFLNMGAEEYFKKFWQPYLKVATYCEDYKQCGYQNNRPYYDLNGNLLGSDLIAGSSRIAFITMDGFIFNIRTSEWDLDNNTGFTKTAGTFIIDLNGSKGPNIWGKDVFVLTRNEDGTEIIPKCKDTPTVQVNNNCSHAGSGECCAEKIRRAGWKIDSSYPW